ncbi:MAG: sugar phosphate nucleotidyltransferase [bacterium]
MTDFKDLFINKSASIIEAMKQLDKTGKKILFVVDDDQTYIGTLTDGDIRRYILKTGKLEGKVLDACNKNSYFEKIGYDKNKVLSIMKENYLKYVPVLDNNQKIVEIISYEEREIKSKLQAIKSIDIPVVIMAGGFGTRLEPVTKILPKPLIPIGDKTILEIIMEKFLEYGIKEIWLSLNYKAYMIKSYLSELNLPIKINYIEETKPLGTIGSLYMLKNKINVEKFILTNCDIIVDIDYIDLLRFHKENKNDITIVSSVKNYNIPYGVCMIGDNGTLNKIEEKPEINFLVNTGMYVINSELLKLIPENQLFHATHFIEKAQKEGYKIKVYPISENSWIDVGEWNEYKKALERLII